ncbi:hypothetical protein ACFX1T_005570 [Malus domestica]
MLAKGNESKGKGIMLKEGSSHSNGPSQTSSGPYHGSSYNQGSSFGTYNANGPHYSSRGFRSFNNYRGRAQGRNNYGPNSRISVNNSLGILGPASLIYLLAQNMEMMFLPAKYATKGVF